MEVWVASKVVGAVGSFGGGGWVLSTVDNVLDVATVNELDGETWSYCRRGYCFR